MNQSDLRKAYAEQERSNSFHLWVTQRKDAILSSVSAHDVLKHFGVDLKFSGAREEQICCPFHGDSSPSARVYASSGESGSGLYCWVCRKRWDVFNLWREFHGDSKMKFTTVLLGLERAFGIATPEAPDMGRASRPRGPTEEEQALYEKLEVCERRLRQAKPHFQMRGFLTLGKLVDILHFQVQRKLIDTEVALAKVQAILDKIAEKTCG